MTNKAKCIGRYVYEHDRDDVDLAYEYKGEIYYVHINNIEGNKPLAQQHRNEQARIDKELELRGDDKEYIETIDDNIKYYLLDMISFD